jgi:AraC-like DNA-binding protein
MDDPFERVEFLWRRGGVSTTQLTDHVSCIPDLLVGQVRGGALTFAPERGVPFRVGDGGAYILPPGASFRARQSHGRPFTYRWCHIGYRLLGAVDLTAVVELPRSRADGSAIGALVEALAGTPAIADPLRRAAERQRLGFALLAELLPAGAGAAAERALLAVGRLRPVLECMAQTDAGALSRDELAGLAGLSPTRFHYVFSAAMGCAPMAYLQRERLRRAQQWLLASDEPVKAIAERIGIPDAFHFSKLFKRQFGLPPVRYRIVQRRAHAGLS